MNSQTVILARRVVIVMAGAVSSILPVSCDRSQPTFDSDRAWAHLVKQVDYGPRVPGSAARDSVAHYLTRTLVGYGGEVSTQRFDVNDPYADRIIPMINVIANFYPDRGKRVMLAAHYDSRPWADEDPVDSLRTLPVPGANDGASGVAVLLEVARLLGEQDPGIGVDFLFFDGEDYGKKEDLDYYLLGSKYFVATRPDYRPVCGVLLDMVAGEGSVIAREGYSRTHAPELTDTLFARAQRLSLEFFRQLDAGPIYDDHVPFLRAGIQVVDLFGYEYAWWHTVDDLPKHCSQDRLGQVGTLVVDFLYDFPF
jgi:Zn-dependent M28 family amino/carboxypeptidase